MFVLEHVSPLHFLGKQINSSKCCSFCGVDIHLVELDFQSVSVKYILASLRTLDDLNC